MTRFGASRIFFGCALVALFFVDPSEAQVARRRPPLSGQQQASGKAAAPARSRGEESLGSTLLTAVLANDLEAAAAVFAASAALGLSPCRAIDWRDKSVLMHAASRNHGDMVKLLVGQKARVDAADYTGGATALMLAARNGSALAVEALIEVGAKVGATTPQGTTVLMQAVANNSLPIATTLLTNGADPNAKDKSGASALSVRHPWAPRRWYGS